MTKATAPTMASDPPPAPSSWRAWQQALRIPSFSASIAPILIGSAYALVSGHANIGLTLAILVAAVCCQAGANLANDYYDSVRGVDTRDRPGSSKVIQQGLLSPRAIKRGMIASFGLATLIGLYIVAITSWQILILALICLAVAYFYTAGPNPLGYVALGELAVFLTMGIAIVAGSYFALTGTLSAHVLLIALPNACLVTAILHVNNVRDIERDRLAGKKTIAMMLAPSQSRLAYSALMAAAFLVTCIVVLINPAYWPILIVGVTIPRAIILVRSLTVAASEMSYNRVLRGTNRLLLEFGLLMAAGFGIVSVVVR